MIDHLLTTNIIIPEGDTSTCIMLDGTSSNNMSKRQLHSLTGRRKRRKVHSYLPSVVGTPFDPADDNTQQQVTPTAEDYANIYFCDSSEEEEMRENLSKKHARDASSWYCSGDQPTVAAETVAISTTSSSTCKQKQKRVSFSSAAPTVHLLESVPPAHAMTSDEKAALCFSKDELEAFKSSAQSSIQDMRSRIMNNCNELVKDRSKFRSIMMSTFEQDTNSSIRGLEHRIFRRKQTRQMLIRDVLECQAHVKGLARFGVEMGTREKLILLAKVSKERSVIARGVAYMDGKDDRDEVYDNVDARRRKRARQTRQVSV